MCGHVDTSVIIDKNNVGSKHSTKGTMRKRNVSMMVEMCVSPRRYYVSLMKLIPRFQQEGF